MTNDFHFDTNIIIKLNHQVFRMKEVPTKHYGNKICYVDGMKCAWNVFRSVARCKRTIRSLKRYPEYLECFVHYPMEESKHSSHYYFRRWVGKDQDVLDIGCGEGFFAQALTADNNRVVGIDILEKPKYKDSLKEYLRADLGEGLTKCMPRLQDRKFDHILEHVANPAQLLLDCHKLLKPCGQVLVSVPNVANISVRLTFLCGNCYYGEKGTLDKTHVRFFTKETTRDMLTAAGHEIVASRMTTMPVELVVGATSGSFSMRAREQTPGLIDRLLARIARLSDIICSPRQGGKGFHMTIAHCHKGGGWTDGSRVTVFFGTLLWKVCHVSPKM